MTRSVTSVGDKYGDAMAEMMKRIKDGTVALRKANRRVSDGGNIMQPPNMLANFEKYKLKDAGKSATIDFRSRQSTDNLGEGDIFDNFRRELKPTSPKENKCATLDTRRTSEPTGPPMTFNFKTKLRSVPSPGPTQSIRVRGSAIDEMRKLNVS